MTQPSGEKELIIGNKQLISLFFVVVALCGVFFAMGYMVRGNSLKGSVSTTTTAADSSATAPSDTTVRRQQPEPPAETADSAAPSTQPAGESDSPTPPIDTKPALDAPALPKPETPEAESGPAFVVQVGALARADADATARTLREQHLPAFTAASSKENLYRVLVGPYHLNSDVAEAKAKLKTLGFSNTIVQKQ